MTTSRHEDSEIEREIERMPDTSGAGPGLRPLLPDEEALPYSRYYYREQARPDPRVLAILDRGPMDPAKALPFDRINDLLAPGYHEVEIGYCIMDDGAGYVAVNSVFPGCTVEMMQWWFAWHAAGPGLRYSIWCPSAHFTISVSEHGRARLHDPSIPLSEKSQNIDHYIVEDVGGGPTEIVLSFLSAQQLGFDMSRFTPPYVACVFGGVGAEGGPGRPRGNPGSIMVHFCREVDGGIEFRSRFWLGYAIDNGRGTCILPPGVSVPIEAPMALARHNVMEYANLASFLPELFAQYGPGVSGSR